VIVFAVNTFEGVRAWFTLLGFKMGRVQLKVSFAAPGHVSVILNLVWSTTFLTLRAMSLT